MLISRRRALYDLRNFVAGGASAGRRPGVPQRRTGEAMIGRPLGEDERPIVRGG